MPTFSLSTGPDLVQGKSCTCSRVRVNIELPPYLRTQTSRTQQTLSGQLLERRLDLLLEDVADLFDLEHAIQNG